jgi:hypothetical protein
MTNDGQLNEPVPPKPGAYTYNVVVSFTVEYSFDETEVEEDPEGKIGTDFNPTAVAMQELQQQLLDELEIFSVSNIEIYAESDQLIGFMSR